MWAWSSIWIKSFSLYNALFLFMAHFRQSENDMTTFPWTSHTVASSYPPGQLYNASLHAVSPFPLGFSIDGEILRAFGILFDNVEEVGQPFMHYTELERWEKIALLHTGDNTYPWANQSREEAFWRTILLDRVRCLDNPLRIRRIPASGTTVTGNLAEFVCGKHSELSFPPQSLTDGSLLYAYIIHEKIEWWGFHQKLPPGPFPWPIVGNHFQTPAVRPWVTWERWAKEYDSPLVTLWFGRQPRIIVSDAWVASELMEKQSDIFSARPRLTMMGDVVNWITTNQTTLPYAHGRRSQAVRNYRTFQADEAKFLIRDLLQDLGDFVLSVERYSVSTASIIGWGRRIDRKNDQVAQLALWLMETVNLITPGIYIMEAIPALRHLPAWLYSTPTVLRMGAATVARYFYVLTEEGAARAVRQPNFSTYMLKTQTQHKLSDVEVAGAHEQPYGRRVDTTSSTMLSCILALAAFPDVQAKAQAEMDTVVGHTRSPTWQDIDANRLPYLTALVKEVLRWRTVTVLGGIPHADTRDVQYRRYHFPAGTDFTGNMWAIHRNERDFPEPDTFRSEHFLKGSAFEKPYPNARGSNPFEWGRRQCSEQPLAEQGLLYVLGRLIWAFDVRPGLDSDGNEVKLDIFAYTNTENTRPEPFKARFTPRSEKIHALIFEEAEQAREALRVYDKETKVDMKQATRNPTKD
ncbi:cytochrome P450 [Aspergillus multicolor]|uniref:cytochrome P450 n=1 Tax=Aspergillus multicolor TaxID=41759 RepID=UPI003CCCE465